MGRCWLREPLLHFIVLGAALFAIDGYLRHGASDTENSKQISLTVDDLRQLALHFQSKWRRPPTVEEFNSMLEDKVQEEVLYREALAMGLDKEDAIIKRRLAQKMQFLAEDVSGTYEPTTAELESWFEKNREKFTTSSRVTFRHLYYSVDHRGTKAQEDAAKALKKIAREPIDSVRASSLADPFMFQDYYGERAPDQLAKEFGPTFAKTIYETQPGSWQGPIESGYGWHLVFVDSIVPGRTPPFQEVEPEVKTAWLNERKLEAWDKTYQSLREQYAVLVPAPEGIESGHTASSPSTTEPLVASSETSS